MNALRTQFSQTLLRARRARNGLSGLGLAGGASQPAKWQVDPGALRSLIKAVTSPTLAPVMTATVAPSPLPAAARPTAPRAVTIAARGGFRGFGLSPGAGTVAGKVGGAAAGAEATSIAAAAGYGAVAGPIGAAAAVVIALAVSLFTKHYFNVGDSNQACAQLEALWQKYTTIQGHVAGRALGWPTMNQLMHAATGAGLFPGNDMHLQFHQGTLQCAGHGDWVDSFLGASLQGAPAGCGAHNCLPDAFKQYQSQRSQIPAGTPDAVYLVDAILLPMNSPGNAKIPWIYNGAQNSQVHQLLYDVADAYIAQYGSGSTPYVEYPAAQIQGQAVAGAEGYAPGTGYVPSAGASVSSASNVIPFPATSGSASYYPPQYGGTDSGTLPGYASGAGYDASAQNGAPAGATAAISTGGFQMNAGTLALIGGSLLGVYLITEMLEKRKKRAHKHG